MEIYPINGKILVKAVAEKKETAGGIIIPDSVQEKINEAEVVAVAENATEEIAVGDRVIYKQYAGASVTMEGEEYMLLESGDLLARYRDMDEIPE